ncbi:MAG: surface-adhesin E family protein [Comamonadaceae bacterium]
MIKLPQAKFGARNPSNRSEKLAIYAKQTCLTALASILHFATPAWAEWSYVTTGESGDRTYIDYATIRKDGNHRIAWSLIDKIYLGKDGQMSELSMREYDCKEVRVRQLSVITREKAMGAGKTLGGHDNPTSWRNVAPETVGEATLMEVCAR